MTQGILIPCVMLYPDPRILESLLKLRDGADAAVLQSPEGLEPVFALYHKNCLCPIEAMLVAVDCKSMRYST